MQNDVPGNITSTDRTKQNKLIFRLGDFAIRFGFLFYWEENIKIQDFFFRIPGQ
jgi:hypothetical protein